MTEDFNKGDVVQLKSGGSQMVVDSIQDGVDGKVAFCIWLDGTKPRKDSFGFHLLKRVEKPKMAKEQTQKGGDWRSKLESHE